MHVENFLILRRSRTGLIELLTFANFLAREPLVSVQVSMWAEEHKGSFVLLLGVHWHDRKVRVRWQGWHKGFAFPHYLLQVNV